MMRSGTDGLDTWCVFYIETCPFPRALFLIPLTLTTGSMLRMLSSKASSRPLSVLPPRFVGCCVLGEGEGQVGR